MGEKKSRNTSISRNQSITTTRTAEYTSISFCGKMRKQKMTGTLSLLSSLQLQVPGRPWGKEDNIVILCSRQQACKEDKRRLKHKVALLKIKGTVAACPIENYRQLVIEDLEKGTHRRKLSLNSVPQEVLSSPPPSLNTAGLTLLTPLSLHLLGFHSSASISHTASRSRDTDYSEKLRKSWKLVQISEEALHL